MTLRLPQEAVVETFLPAFRSRLADALARRGLTQQAIADELGVSQPAVSNYVQDRVDVHDALAADPQVGRVVEEVADGIADGSLDDVDVLARTMDLIDALEDRGPLCAIHEDEMPSLQGLGCDLCVAETGSEMLAERDVLADVRRAARRLSALPGAADHIPNVGSNVAACMADATDVEDVAAVPGRIHVAGDRVHVPAGPTFGASRHVAGTVLAAHTVDPSIRGAVNVATSEALLAAVDGQGWDRLRFDASYEDRRDRLEERFEEEGVPTVVYHEGAFGIEPVAYVLGTSAVDAVDRAGTLIGEAGSDRIGSTGRDLPVGR